MEKRTKNIITRKMIESELDFLTKADMRAFAVFGVIIVILASILFAVFLKTRYYPHGIFAGVLCVALLIDCYCMLANRIKFKKGKFEISVEALSYKDEAAEKHGKHLVLVGYFHFPGFTRVRVSETEFQLASNGDEFYIVHYKGKDRAVLLYSLKRYEYKEE